MPLLWLHNPWMPRWSTRPFTKRTLSLVSKRIPRRCPWSTLFLLLVMIWRADPSPRATSHVLHVESTWVKDVPAKCVEDTASAIFTFCTNEPDMSGNQPFVCACSNHHCCSSSNVSYLIVLFPFMITLNNNFTTTWSHHSTCPPSRVLLPNHG